jgi:hypothetical protein
LAWLIRRHARPDAPAEFRSEQISAAAAVLTADIGREKQRNAAKEREIQRLREALRRSHHAG